MKQTLFMELLVLKFGYSQEKQINLKATKKHVKSKTNKV
jgi:hypothetical protein